VPTLSLPDDDIFVQACRAVGARVNGLDAIDPSSLTRELILSGWLRDYYQR
jgi:hypothetical protein